MSGPPDKDAIPIRPAQVAQVQRRIDDEIAKLKGQRDELGGVIARLAEGLSVLDRSPAQQSADLHNLVGLLGKAKSQLDEISAALETLQRK